MKCFPYSKKEYFKAASSILKGSGLPDRFEVKGDESCTKTVNLSPITRVGLSRAGWFDSLAKIVAAGREKRLLNDVIVHGSYGDGSYTKFSDLDISIVLSEAGTVGKNSIKIMDYISREVNPFLLRADPLQHHGVFLLWKQLLNNYNELILPVSSYMNAKSFYGLSLKIRKSLHTDVSDQKDAFFSTIKHLLTPEKYFFQYGVQPYAIKRLLSNFLLLPAFYYQSKHQMLSKESAIIKMMENGCMDIRCAIEAATAIRKIWPGTPAWPGALRSLFVLKGIPNGRKDLIMCALYRHRSIEREFKNNFLPLLPAACEALLYKVEHDNY